MSNECKLFEIYLKELLEWNKKINLTAVTGPEEIKIRHFEDSLSILQAVDLDKQKVVDIGPGAGFPGIPLKIACPNIKLTLVEATRKKVEFLKHIVSVLGLSDVEVVWGRAEEIQKDKAFASQFDVVLARAVAKLPELIKYCLPFLKRGGIFIAQKQDDVEAEIEASRNVLKKYSGILREVKKVKIGDATRSLVVVERTSPA